MKLSKIPLKVGVLLALLLCAGQAFAPVEGLRLWIWDEDVIYHYTGDAWASEA